MNTRLLCGTVALLASFGAMAESKKELATKIVQAQQTGVENVGKQLAARTTQRILQITAQGLQRMPADKRADAAKDVEAEIKKFHGEMEPQFRKRASELAPVLVIPSYEERFTEDELKQILAWVQSPVSRKLAQAEGELANALAEKVMTDMRPVLEPRVKTLEATVAKRLGLTPGSAASAPKK